ncbi:MAG: GIY-YIG nuclease family protein [Alphaproteobacteria bacterium]
MIDFKYQGGYVLVMSGEPYSINIHVLTGDSQGVRIIGNMNWTGKVFYFPRSEWNSIKKRDEFNSPGVYILFGLDDNDYPTLYIGEGDGIIDRINSHYKDEDKNFFDWGIIILSTNNTLTKSHIQWLEFELCRLAIEKKRCDLKNRNQPDEPTLDEASKSDIKKFLKEVLQILPLVGLKAFDEGKTITPMINENTQVKNISKETHLIKHDIDTIVVPAWEDRFQKSFIKENRWYAIRIHEKNLEKIKYIAVYRTDPIKAITHLAEVKNIEEYGESRKYLLNFVGSAKEINHIKWEKQGDQLQGPRYTTKEKLLKAEKISDL